MSSKLAAFVRDSKLRESLKDQPVQDNPSTSSKIPAEPSGNGNAQPSSPRSNSHPKQPNGRIPSTSLDIDMDYDDSMKKRFNRNDAAFRGPLSPPLSPQDSPKSTRGGRQGSWQASGEHEGFFKRWVEEPLGLTALESERHHSEGEPSTSLPIQQHQDTPAGPSRTTSGDLTMNRPPKQSAWDSTARRLRLKSAHNTERGESQEETDTFDESLDHNASNSRPPAPRLATRRWSMLKNRFAPTTAAKSGPPTASAAVSPDVNISDELLGGGLATLMLKLHFDHDEQDRRRIPVLLHHIKIRVSDSIRPLSGNSSAFRVEVCDLS